MGNFVAYIPELDHHAASRIDTYRCVSLRKSAESVGGDEDGSVYEVVATTPDPDDDDWIQWRVTCTACSATTIHRETRSADWYFGLITKECGDRQRIDGTIRAAQSASHTFSLQHERCRNDARLDFKVELY